MSIRLVVLEGDEVGREFEFSEHETFMVGRGPEAHLQLAKKDRHCSRLHFMIEVNPPLCRLWDMESNNGTFVNGQRVEGRVDLKDGDRIKAGRTLVQVHIGSAVFSDPTIKLDEQHSTATGTARARRLDGYELGEELGRGAMGVVYRALAEGESVPVAIKLIHPAIRADEKTQRRFIREVSVLRRLQHRRIVRYRAMGSVGEQLYFVMEYVEGTTLADLLEERGQIPMKTAAAIVGQILEGLEYAHTMGYVHRDIKPSNILLARTGSGKYTVKITDFGLARIYQASRMSGLTMQGEMGGTPLYAAPEQLSNFRGAVPASDQYSLAVVLYEMLTGELPYPRAKNPAQACANVLLEPVRPVREYCPELSVECERMLAQALAKRVEDRFPDVGQLRVALQSLARLA